uniref:Transposase n=1 Tax=Magnetococcus massalia (strain MO-1) TaxID=451514 RepID=A0A1S7LDW7_MAGMO|nr:transposase [Candidatus Magnetococcus massalia]
MSYSTDLRERVVDFINEGGSKAEASRRFKVGLRTIYYWLQRPDLAPTPRGNCDRKLKKEELAKHVAAYPDALLRERAEHFGVRISTVSAALTLMKVRKKNATLRRT